MARPENADGADHILLGIIIGRDHQRAARIDEELVFGTDENLHTVSLGGRVEKTKRVLPRLQLVKQLPDGI